MTTTETTTDKGVGNLLAVLNDDCIYQILERLLLKDLCVFSRTCKGIQALCDNQFRRKYKNEATEIVNVRIEDDGKLWAYQDYVKYFDNFIKNVSIFAKFELSKEVALSSLANFVKRKCDQNLQKIYIYGNLEVTPSFCKEIETFLRNIEVVEFWQGQISGEAILLRHCTNLTKLILRGWIHAENFDAILQQKCRRLTHFYCLNFDAMNLNAEKWKIFFQTNEQIQCVALSYGSGGDSDHAVKSIQTLEYAFNLQHLLLSIDKALAKRFDDICRQLNVLCARDNFKTLELQFVGRGGVDALMKLHANQLAKWKQFTKIHLNKLRLSRVIPAFRSLVHLKIVVLQWSGADKNWDRWSNFNELSALVDGTQNMDLPQIEEVQFEEIGRNKTLSTYVMQTVRHWTNLKRILVPKNYLFQARFDLDELNLAREKLKNASALTIFTNHAGNATNLDQELVKLQFAKFKFDEESPFQEYFSES